MRKRLLYIFVILALLLWYFRKSITAKYLHRVTGLQAVTDAATTNTYTTYNTAIYYPPFIRSIVQFFKAGADPSSSNQSAVNTVDYSVQG